MLAPGNSWPYRENALAALSEADLIKILGPNFRAAQEAAEKASGVQDDERAVSARIDAIDGTKGTMLYGAVIGAILAGASFISVTGQTLYIQVGVGAAIALASLGFYFYLRRSQASLREKVAALRSKSAQKSP